MFFKRPRPAAGPLALTRRLVTDNGGERKCMEAITRMNGQSPTSGAKLDPARLLGFDQAPSRALRGELSGALAAKVGTKPRPG